MKNWARRIRAAFGMGLIWGAVWSAAGALLARVPGFSSDLPFAILFAPLGFVSGIIFAGLLVGIESRHGFERTSFSRFTVWGAASGLLLTGIFVLGAALRGGDWWAELLLFGPPLVLSSAFCAAGSLAIAKQAERRALCGDTGRPAKATLHEGENLDVLGRGK